MSKHGANCLHSLAKRGGQAGAPEEVGAPGLAASLAIVGMVVCTKLSHLLDQAEFEQGIRDVVGDHCEIHTFDPIGFNKRNGNFSIALEGLAAFHQYGYGTEEDATRHGYKTLAQIMDDLGHTGRTIDIFKIDCEWCEWHIYPQWLGGVDIRQILVETHNAPMPEAKKFFYELHDAGYVIFSKEANYQNAAGAVEYGFVKLLPDFFRFNDSTYMYKAS